MIKNEVLVTIRGMQSDGQEEDSIETIQPGKYRHIGSTDVVSYDELLLENESEPTISSHNLLKIQPHLVVLSKKGPVQSEMEFCVGKPYHGFYQTPYGIFDMTIETAVLNVVQTDEEIALFIEYFLELNGTPISKNKLEITIR